MIQLLRCLSLCAMFFASISLEANTFRVLLWDAAVPSLYTLNDEDFIPIQASKRKFSPEYKNMGEGPLVLYKQVRNAEGIDEYVPAIEILGVNTAKVAGILLTMNSKGGLSAHVMDISKEKLPNGHYSFINFSNRELAFQFGDEVFYLKPSKEELLDSAEASSVLSEMNIAEIADAKSGGQSIIVRAAEKQANRWEPVLNVRWMMSRNSRTLVFVYNGRKGDLAIRRITDRSN